MLITVRLLRVYEFIFWRKRFDLPLLIDCIYFLLSSASDSQFDSMKQYILNVINQFDVDTDKMNVGLVQFGENPVAEFQLSTFSVCH